MQREPLRKLAVVPAQCCVCADAGASPVGAGYDFEYMTSDDVFTAYRCDECSSVFLNPRPDISEFYRIYPQNYHSLDYSSQKQSFVSKVRARLEARRLLRYCKGLPEDARILDVGCGDGFHLKLLAQHGRPGWSLDGVDLDKRALSNAAVPRVRFFQGSVDDAQFEAGQYDMVYTIQTLEHVANPDKFLFSILRVLKPGGRLVIVTDNTDSIDFQLFKQRYWGGYHFPRHWNLFNTRSLGLLARKAGFEVDSVQTIVSPVNWVYSFHCLLVDKRAPRWLIDQFTLKSTLSLAAFTALDTVLQRFGRGALLNACVVKPHSAIAPPQAG